MLEGTGALPKEGEDLLRVYQAMHEEQLSQQLAGGGCGAYRGGEEKAGRGSQTIRRQKLEKARRSEKGTGLRSKGVWIVCLAKSSEDFSRKSQVLFFRCVLAVLSSVLVVTAPFLNVNVVCEVVFSDLDFQFVEPQTFSLARKRKVCFVKSREFMKIDETPVKAPLATRRKAIVPTPQQSPPPPLDGTLLQTWPMWPDPPQKSPSKGTTLEVELWEWNTETNIGGQHGTEQSLREWNRGESLKVEIEEWWVLSAWARGVRGRHQAHSDER